jgi:GTP-binding protein
MLPVIAIIGQPNVGKSTLFNRLTKTQDALVVDMPGVTRDRHYGEGKLGGNPYIVIDTGGITGDEAGIDAMMAGQSWQAIIEADVVLFMVDAQHGATPNDHFIARKLRQEHAGKKVYLLVNKSDGLEEQVAVSDFFQLSLGEPIAIAASHGRGVRSMIQDVLAPFYEEEQEIPEEEEEARGIKIALVGRPNVGKSTLTNRMLGEERVIVYDQPGTTRDSIFIPFEREGKNYTIIDTAGIRRRKNVSEVVEKFSVVKTLKAIEDAHVVVYLIDGQEGITDQDMSLLGFIIEAGRALVVTVNKWDGLSDEQRKKIKSDFDRQLQFVDFARRFFISALHGTNVGHIFDAVQEAYENASQDLQTSVLTRILQAAVKAHQPPMREGRRIKLRMAHAGGKLPPIIVIHGNIPTKLPLSYRRYLSNHFRKSLKMDGTPIRFRFKAPEES